MENMKDLVAELEELKDSNIGNKIDIRLKEFEEVGYRGNKRWFSELSFCVLTANSTARLGMEIQNELGIDGFVNFPQRELQKELKRLGHRFYRTRAKYIVENRKYSTDIKDIITQFTSPREARDWLVENAMGIGYKEGSHFLRNVGHEDLMILDRHTLRIICDYCLIEEIPKSLTRKRYLAIEEKTKDLAEEVNLSLGELDLYIWYMDTGEVLK